jgi:hypothetical protein
MHRLGFFLLLASLLFACAPEPPAAPGSSAPSEQRGTGVEPGGAAPDAAAPAAPVTRASQSNVIITLPRDGATIRTNPIRLEGRARTFENHVEIRVEDDHGQQLASRYATAVGELGQFNPWSDELLLTSDPGKAITVTAIERSAENGAIRTSHSIRINVEGAEMPVTLYFPNSNRSGTDCTAVEKVVRDVPASVAVARLALEALVRGPLHPESAAGFRSPFPERAALRSVSLRGGVLTADFNEAMQNVGGSCRVQAIRAAIERTMKEIPGVDRVVITAMGDEKLALQP